MEPAAAGAEARRALLAPANPPQPRLVNAAHQFEAAMMKELLKPLNEDGLFAAEEGKGDGQGGEGGGGSNAALRDYASEALSEAISRRGGFGVAERIIRELSAHTAAGQVHLPGPGRPGKAGVEGSLPGTAGLKRAGTEGMRGRADEESGGEIP
jgi:Rod binding domain-containing protein